jgi:hypothetical protein
MLFLPSAMKELSMVYGWNIHDLDLLILDHFSFIQCILSLPVVYLPCGKRLPHPQF